MTQTQRRTTGQMLAAAGGDAAAAASAAAAAPRPGPLLPAMTGLLCPCHPAQPHLRVRPPGVAARRTRRVLRPLSWLRLVRAYPHGRGAARNVARDLGFGVLSPDACRLEQANPETDELTVVSPHDWTSLLSLYGPDAFPPTADQPTPTDAGGAKPSDEGLAACMRGFTAQLVLLPPPPPAPAAANGGGSPQKQQQQQQQLESDGFVMCEGDGAAGKAQPQQGREASPAAAPGIAQQQQQQLLDDAAIAAALAGSGAAAAAVAAARPRRAAAVRGEKRMAAFMGHGDGGGGEGGEEAGGGGAAAAAAALMLRSQPPPCELYIQQVRERVLHRRNGPPPASGSEADH